MTMHCPHLDAYLDGHLSDAQAQDFEAHALACPRCDAALAEPLAGLRDLAGATCPPALLAEVLDAPERPDPDALPLFADGYRQLAAVTCPPEVVAGALRAARRAPDRTAQRRPRRLARWAVGLAAALAVAVGVWEGGPERVPDLAASDSAVSGPVAVGPAGTARPEPSQTTETPESPISSDPDDPAARPAGGQARQAPPPEPTPAARPAELTPSASAPLADDPAQTLPPIPAEPEITEADIENAQRDLALAFRLVDEAQTRARSAVREEAGALSFTFDQTLPF